MVIKKNGKAISTLIKRNADSLAYNLQSTKALLLRKKKFKETDKWLFSLEELPKFGKEYWFIHFASTGKDCLDQLVLTFGRPEGKIKVNGSTMDSRKQKNSCASLIWAYQNKKIPLVNSISLIHLGSHFLDVSNGNTKLKLSGRYPDYLLELRNRKQKIAEIKLFNCDERYPEFLKTFKGPFGFELVNLHMDFKGILNNKKASGKALVQKVIATGPFMPWRWGRLVFNDGSILSFFKIHFGSRNLRYIIDSSAYFCDGKTGKNTRFEGITIKGTPDSKLWMIQSNDGNLRIVLEPYSSEVFRLKARGKFEYNEYLVKVISLEVKTNRHSIKLKDLGEGRGILENTNGHLL